MGTRSTTHVYELGTKTSPSALKRLKPILSIYRQFDGYPSGHGADLAIFLDGMKVVNGIGSDTPAKTANGAGCLAAQLVKALKTGIGGVYITTHDDTQCYDYHVYVRAERHDYGPYGPGAKIPDLILIKVIGYLKNSDGRGIIFEGTVPEFVAWVQTQD